VLPVQGVWTQVLRLPKPVDQKTTAYTGALASFLSNHLLHLRQIGTQSFYVPPEGEEQEALSSPRIYQQSNARLVNSFLQLLYQ
jgi:hypothetical protein